MNANSRRTPRLALAALLVASFGAGTALAVPFVRSIEKDIETSSSDVSIPGSPGTVILSICGNNCPNSLQLTAQTQAFIGTKAVTLAALHAYTSGNRVTMTLFYDPASKVLNRVIADGPRN